jgi:hypothetical protein
MLGVHRPSVSLAAGALQRAGIVEYRRGNVTVLDADALHDAACECVDVILGAYDELHAPVAGDSPGTPQQYAAMVAYTATTLAYSRSLHARAARLHLEAASLSRTARWSERSRRLTAAEATQSD